MTIKEMRAETGLSQVKFAEHLGIPRRTIENWESGTNHCPQYVRDLIQYRLTTEGMIKGEA